MSIPLQDWPAGVVPITFDDLGRLGIDPNDQLFWDGRPVEVRRTFVLSGLQRLVAIVVTIFAVLGGFGGFLSGLNEVSIFLCARNLHWVSCPGPVHSP